MSMPDLDAIFKQYGDWWCREHGGQCDRMNVVQKGYEDHRLVLSDERIEYYGSADSLEKPTTGARQKLTNRTSVEQSQTVQLTKSTTSTFAWSLTEGFKLSISVKLAAGVPSIVSGETTISGELSFSSTQTQTVSETKTWQVNQPVRVPAQTEVEAVLLIDEEKFSQRFHSKAVLSGYVCSNSPDRIDGHYFWFHAISSIFEKFPTRGFTVQPGNRVFWEGDGVCEGLLGVRTRLNLTEKPLDNPNALRSYTIIDPMTGAGIAGVHQQAT